MMPYPALANHRYFCRVERLLLDGGERFATVVDADGAPAYYPTCLALARRSRSVSVETLAAEAATQSRVRDYHAYKRSPNGSSLA